MNGWRGIMEYPTSTERVSAAWIWTRIKRIGASRRSLMQEELGYIEGGSATVIDALGADFQRRGGRIVLNAPVQQILVEGGRATGVRVGGETLPADAVISTITTSRFRALAQLRLGGRQIIPRFGRVRRQLGEPPPRRRGWSLSAPSGLG